MFRFTPSRVWICTVVLYIDSATAAASAADTSALCRRVCRCSGMRRAAMSDAERASGMALALAAAAAAVGDASRAAATAEAVTNDGIVEHFRTAQGGRLRSGEWGEVG